MRGNPNIFHNKGEGNSSEGEYHPHQNHLHRRHLHHHHLHLHHHHHHHNQQQIPQVHLHHHQYSNPLRIIPVINSLFVPILIIIPITTSSTPLSLSSLSSLLASSSYQLYLIAGDVGNVLLLTWVAAQVEKPTTHKT